MIDRMNEETIWAIPEAMPIETTVIDAKDAVIGWNKHESLPMVEKIVAEMKSGARDKVRFWIDHALEPGGRKHKRLIEFYALRDARGRCLGCMECTQDVQDIMELTRQKRLMD